ncbi:MAG: class I SAM-dependent methyltransferase [Eggerthellaceae bacterium]|nr:class I SAM-dependent methyltransferase [Eggerthellaceae bacterium]
MAGLLLVRDEGGLSLSDGDMSIRGDFTRMIPRLKPANLSRELLAKAARVKGCEKPVAFDATAGLGEDSLLLAAAGFTVFLHERNPVIAALLNDALERAALERALADATARMHLVVGDSVQALRECTHHPDVVLLDPMFPGRTKSAAVKKKLQLLQRLEHPCEDEQALLDAAFAAHPRKIVVKRPQKGPYLAGRKPDYSLEGKAIRFDCYALPR